LDVASGPSNCAAWYFEEILLERKEFISHDVLVECEQLADVSRDVCRAAEAALNYFALDPRVSWPRYSRRLTFEHSSPHPFLCWLEFG